MDRIKRYIDELIVSSTPDRPMWNIEKIKSGKPTSWNYVDGCMLKAIIEMYEIAREEKYLHFVDQFTSYFIEEEGTIKYYDKEEYNLEPINAGKNLFKLYKITGKKKYRKAIDKFYDQLISQPRTQEGNFWHKKIYPHQVWLDGLYMALPFYMAYETQFNNMNNYMDIYRQFLSVEANMRDSRTGLYYYGYDASREMIWCDKNTGVSKHFWGRSLGWYVMALVDTLEEMDEQIFYEYRRLMTIFKEVIDSLLIFQDEETGMWYQVVDEQNREGNDLELSGSAMIAYALLKGVRLGYLSERYKQWGEKAFSGICERYLREKEGSLCLEEICLVAPFLLAYTEILRTN